MVCIRNATTKKTLPAGQTEVVDGHDHLEIGLDLEGQGPAGQAVRRTLLVPLKIL